MLQQGCDLGCLRQAARAKAHEDEVRKQRAAAGQPHRSASLPALELHTHQKAHLQKRAARLLHRNRLSPQHHSCADAQARQPVPAATAESAQHAESPETAQHVESAEAAQRALPSEAARPARPAHFVPFWQAAQPSQSPASSQTCEPAEDAQLTQVSEAAQSSQASTASEASALSR